MNKKTKMSIAALSAILIFGIVPAVYGLVIAESSKIQVTLISQEPDPAAPGEVVDVRFKVENMGGSGTGDMLFEVLPKYPFTVYSGSAERDLGAIQSYQNGENAIIVLYKIKVDENAAEGNNYLDVRYRIGDSKEWIVLEDFVIRVRTRDLVLSVDSIETSPSNIAPGSSFELSMTLNNNADSLIKDVKVKLGLSASDTPFAPSTSTSEKQIFQISSKTGKIMKFDLVALPEAEGGIYKIPVTISYTDETGTSYSKDDVISLKVSAEPELLISIDSSEITEKVQQGKVSVKIVNKGLTNIKLSTARLGEIEGAEIVSEPEVYVGNIDTDDYETADFTIKISSYKKEVALPVEISYRDSLNKEHKQKADLTLKTYNKGVVMTVLSKILSLAITIVIIAAVVLGIRWLYKRRKKK